MGCLRPLGVSLRVLPIAGDRRIFHMGRPLRAADEYILGLRRVDGTRSAREDNALLGRQTIRRNPFGRRVNGLGCRGVRRHGGWGLVPGENGPLLGVPPQRQD